MEIIRLPILTTLTDISGYVTLDHGIPYSPPDNLVQLLESPVALIYVSIHIDLLNNPERFVYFLKEASSKYGFTFLLPGHFQSVSGISGSNIFVLHDVPISKWAINALEQSDTCSPFLLGWLMPKIEVLITHGDADMVSMGLRHGKPMVTLPAIRE